MPRSVLCINNTSFETSLYIGKTYTLIEDSEYDQNVDTTGWVRVIDESGEDYLYPMNYFAAIVPEIIQ